MIVTSIPAGQSLTGERTLPGIWHENYWFRRHEAVYLHLASLIDASRGGRVLDAGCGEGYGCALLARSGSTDVVGLDYDRPTLAHLRESYPLVAPVSGNLVALPFDDATFDAVVSLQVIEHIWEQPRFVAECARVTRPGGWVALSTPNRLTFSPGVGRGEKPLNPFHVNELDVEELHELVARTLLVGSVLGLRHGPRLAEWEAVHGSVVAAQLAQPYPEWSDELMALVASLTADDFVLDEHDLDNSLDLVVVAHRG